MKNSFNRIQFANSKFNTCGPVLEALWSLTECECSNESFVFANKQNMLSKNDKKTCCYSDIGVLDFTD